MARQQGSILFRGTLYGLTFYRFRGSYFVRRKSSLDRQRVMHDPAFARSRRCARRFGQASRIAGRVYRALPGERRRPGLIGRLTGIANRLLCSGCPPGMVQARLIRQYGGPSAAERLAESRQPKAVFRKRGEEQRGFSSFSRLFAPDLLFTLPRVP